MKKLMSLIVLASLGFACTDDDIRSEHVLNEGPKIVGFSKAVENMAYFEDTGVEPDQVQVVLLGRGDGNYPTSPIEVTYEIDEENSTAELGREFNFADDTRKIKIPAGGSFVDLPILVNTGSLNPTEKTELVLNLTASTNSVVGAQYQTIKIVFVGCPTNLDGDYVSGSTAVKIIKLSPNTYESNYVPSLNGMYWFQFSDVCAELEVLDWEYQSAYPMSGANGGPVKGTVQDNGDLIFNNVTIGNLAGYVNRTWTFIRQ